MRSADHAAYRKKSSVAGLSVRDGKYVGIEPENFTTVNVRQTQLQAAAIYREMEIADGTLLMRETFLPLIGDFIRILRNTFLLSILKI